MFICICKAVTEKDLIEKVQGGCCSVNELADACGAGTDCGSCQPKLEKYLSQHSLNVMRENKKADDARDN